ncbi:MAG TPA: OmpW family outer membrane protein [Saprospiraceae bacterium]|nr:OmpW family outer membrane protein [Saprospiraceae bacterium]
MSNVMQKSKLILCLLLLPMVLICQDNKLKVSEKSYNTSQVKQMIHFGLGAGDYSITDLGISIYHQLLPTFMVGVSTHYLGVNGKNTSIPQWQKIPVTLESSYDIKKYNQNRSSIYLKLGIGYSFTLNGSYYDNNEFINKRFTDGWAVSPGLGYRFNILENTGLNFDVNYHLIADKTEDDKGIVISDNLWNHIIFRTSLFF